jgi:hypothetical protein
LLKVTVKAYFFVPCPAHWHTLIEVTWTELADEANAGAVTPTATRGTLQAAPRATERRETCGEDMRKLQGDRGAMMSSHDITRVAEIYVRQGDGVEELSILDRIHGNTVRPLRRLVHVD